MLDRRVFLKRLGGTLALAIPAAGRAQSDEAPQIVDAIVRAGRQRVLTLRCAKAWLMQALGVMPVKAMRWQADSTARFEEQLRELKQLGSTTALGLLVRLGADWEAYKAALAKAPARETAGKLFARSEALLTSADMAARAYENMSGTRLGWLVNASGRQSMLSQRAAAFVYLAALGVEQEAAAEGLAAAQRQFAEGIAELKSAPENTQRINNELALVEQQWILFEGALADSSSPRALQDIATTSELMLQQLTILDELYAQIPRGKMVPMAQSL